MTSNAQRSDQRRTNGRVRVQNVRGNGGLILDASAGGLRIKGKAPSGSHPGSILMLEVTAEGESLMLLCEIRWMQRHPFRGSMFGVSFVDIDDEQRRALFSMIRRASADTRCRWDAA